MMYRKSVGLLIGALLASVSSKALAQACVDTAPGPGGVVTCSIVTTDAHSELDAGVTINVLDTASLNGATAISVFNTGATVNNAGTLNGSTTFLIGVSEDIFVNSGVVTGTVGMVQGNDQFTNAAGGVINGIVDMGSFGGVGDNTVVLQAGSTVAVTGQIFLTPGGTDLLRIEEGASFLGTANGLSNPNTTAVIEADGVELTSLLNFGRIDIDTAGTVTSNFASTQGAQINLQQGALEVNAGTTFSNVMNVSDGLLQINAGTLFSSLVTLSGGEIEINQGSTFNNGLNVQDGVFDVNTSLTVNGALNATGGLVDLGTDTVSSDLAASTVTIGANARLQGRGAIGDFVTFVAPIQIDGEVAPDLDPAGIQLIANGNAVLSSSSVLDLTVGFGQDIGAAAGSERVLFASTFGSNNTTVLDGGALRISSTAPSEFIFGEFDVTAVSSFVSTSGGFGTIDTGDDFILVGADTSGFFSTVTLQSVFAGSACEMTMPGDNGVITCTADINNGIAVLNEGVTLNVEDSVTLGGDIDFLNTGATVNNAGVLNGAATFLIGASDDTFVNSGVVNGVIGMVQGNDRFTNAAGGVVNGIVDVGSFGGVGDNIVTLQSGSTVSETAQIFLTPGGTDLLRIEEGASFLGTANGLSNPNTTAVIEADGVELTNLLNFGRIDINTTGTVTSGVVSTQAAQIDLQRGVLEVNAGTLFSSLLTLNGGEIEINQGSTFANGVTVQDGVFDANAGVTVSGPGFILNAGQLDIGSDDASTNFETQSLFIGEGGAIMGRGAFGSFTPGVLADIVIDGTVMPDARADATPLSTTFTALGNITLGENANFIANFGPASALPGGGDGDAAVAALLGVTGTTTIEGGSLTLNQVFGTSPLVGMFEFPIISSAGAVTGAFDDISVNGNFVISDIDYLANSVVVTVRTLLGGGQIFRDDASALADYFNSLVNSEVETTRSALTELVGLDPANGDLEGALQEIAPQSYASVSGISRVLGFGVLETVSGANQYQEISEGRKTIWAGGVLSASSQDSDTASVSGFDADAVGALFGFDYAINDSLTVGAFGGYTDFDQEFDNIAARTEGDGFVVGGKAEINYANLQLSIAIGNIFGEAVTTRNFSSIGSSTSAEFDIDTAFARAGAAYSLSVFETIAVTPHLRATLLRSTIGEYAEAGSAAVNFQADQTSIDALYTDIGSTFSTRAGLAGGRILSYVEAGLRYEVFGNDAVTEAGLVNERARYVVQGQETERSGGYVGAGFAASLTDAIDVKVEGRSVFGGDYNRQNLTLRLEAAL